MDFQLYKGVVLQANVPDENLRAHELGAIVDRHDVTGLEPEYSIEFFNMLGQTVAVATLPHSLLRAPNHSDRPTAQSAQGRATG